MKKADVKKALDYEKFMYNPDNQGKCKDCPENNGYDTFYLCGQQKCWVTVHCEKMKEV